uniref:Uncharacterized protein n=1 Tax=Aegilops tauschii subsp. strangulata TaxID=200361 RepID=A0A453NXI4_AEGTS
GNEIPSGTSLQIGPGHISISLPLTTSSTTGRRRGHAGVAARQQLH